MYSKIDKLTFEYFIRKAFGLENNTLLERYGDPAGLANKDLFSDFYINQVKIATTYSMEIYNKYIIKKSYLKPNEEELFRMESIISDVLDAKNLDDISELITEYILYFEEKFFKFMDQDLKHKPLFKLKRIN